MADEDRDNEGPSLELPSLRFGRRRRKGRGETPETSPQPVPEPREPGEAEAEPEPEPAVTETRPLFADEAAPEPLSSQTSAAPAPTAPAATEEAGPEAPQPRRKRRTRRQRRQRSLPVLGGMAAAMVTGVLVGVITVGLTWASQRLCEVVRGTSSCGGPGILLLLAIMVAMVLLGAVLLRAWGLPDPGSTSFLAVGLLAVIALLFLVDVLFSTWMIIVIPLCAVVTFALAHWVTTAFVEPADR